MKLVNIFFLLIFAIFSHLCKKAEQKNQVTWQQDPRYGWELTLKQDGSLEYIFLGEGCGHFSGKYSYTSSGFTYSGQGDETECGNVKSGEGECKINENSKNFFYLKEINCSGPIDVTLFSELTTGLQRNVEDVPVIMVIKRGTIKENAYIRSAPSKSAKPSECFFESVEGRKPTPVLPANQYIFVVGKTLQKEKVDKWENFWYFVDAGDWYSDCQGWVFGEFIDFKEK